MYRLPFSPLIPFRQSGMVTGITILCALLVAVVVVPPLLAVWAAYHELRRRELAEAAVPDETGGLVIQRDGTVAHVAPDGTGATVLNAADHTAEYGPPTLRLQDVTTCFSVPNAVRHLP